MMMDFLSGIDWGSSSTYSSALGWVVAFASIVVAPVVRLTPTKKDDRILAKALALLERFSLVAFNRPTKELPK